MRWHVLWVPVSLSPALLAFILWTQEPSGPGGTDGGLACVQQHRLPLTNADLAAVTAECLICQSEKWKWSCSVVSDTATAWTVAYQVPLSVGFSRQEYWSGLPFPSPSSVHSLSCVRLFVTPWIAAHQASLSITNCRSHSNSRPSSRWYHPAISSSVIPFSSCLQFLPVSESLPMSQLFAWGGQSTGVSALASVLPKKSQGWSPLEWAGWISLQSKALSRVFSNTTVQMHQFFGTQLSSQSNSHIYTWPQEKP